MFDVGGISSANTGSNFKPLFTGSNASIMDRDDFLMLLIAELQHQDPFDPVSNQDYVSQLAQFSTLDELRGIRESLDSQKDNAATNLNAQSIGMIGRTVTAQDNTVEYAAGRQASLKMQLPSDTEVVVTVYNTRGQVVRTDSFTSPRLAGWSTYTFDGKNDLGYTLPDGVYAVRVTSRPDVLGNALEYPVYQTGRVTGVDFTGQTTMLELEGGQRVALAGVVGVQESKS